MTDLLTLYVTNLFDLLHFISDSTSQPAVVGSPLEKFGHKKFDMLVDNEKSNMFVGLILCCQHFSCSCSHPFPLLFYHLSVKPAVNRSQLHICLYQFEVM